MERGYSENREQDSDYESDSGTTRQGLSIENDFGVGSLLPIATRMMESCTKAVERICDKVEVCDQLMSLVYLDDFPPPQSIGKTPIIVKLGYLILRKCVVKNSGSS